MKKYKQRKIIVSVTNDLITDNRVHKICLTLIKMGFRVLLIGRKKPESMPLKPRAYKMKRLNLLFQKGPLFYAEYNLRLLFYIIFSGPDVLLANDLDSLPANFLASKVNRVPLVYDSHEYFTEVPELLNRPAVKSFWEWVEKRIVPRVKYAYTVCDSIANEYHKKYGVRFQTIRNLPYKAGSNPNAYMEKSDKKSIIIYQGAVNVGRGLTQAIGAMKFIENAILVIAGNGDIINELKDLVKTENLSRKVRFAGQLPFEELSGLTQTASLGISVEEDLGLNYRFALPNKLFDYIQARIPVIVSDLPEMAAVVNRYQIGLICPSHDPQKMAECFNEALTNINLRKTWDNNLKLAASELIWEKEEKKIENLFQQFL